MNEKKETRTKVLLVDDEPHIGKVFGLKLRLTGYDVLITTSGAEAIELVRAEKPDIMLLDILMPGVTGFEVLEKVRAFSSVPVVVFTARPEYSKKAMTMGANDTIDKPFDPERLIEKIKKVLGNKRQK